MTQSQRKTLGLVLAAITLYLAFFALHQTATRMEVTFKPPWTLSDRGELNFWLGSIFFLLPAGICAGLALMDPMTRLLSRAEAGSNAQSERTWWGVWAILYCAAVLVYWIAHETILLGFPITDDEMSARFGGQVLAAGQALAPMPSFADAFPHLFMLSVDGAWSVLDFTGVQLAWAISELTGTDSLVFHLLAAAPIPAFAYLMTRTLGRSWAIVAAFIFAFSPMAFALSYTTHAHLLSRGFLAIGLAVLLVSHADRDWVRIAAGAVGVGFAFVCRPFETVAILAPLGLAILMRARTNAEDRNRVILLVLAAVLGLTITGIHNYELSGNPLLSARFMDNEFPHPYGAHYDGAFAPDRFWERFGANTTYNAMMLSVWFLGPLGVVLALVGAFYDWKTKALGLGVLAVLAMGMLHDDHGLHVVGPIHYSECAAPLVILAVFGLYRARQWFMDHSLDWRRALAVFAVLVPVTFGTFNAWHAYYMHQQSVIHLTLYDLVDGVANKPAVVLAPKYGFAWRMVPVFAHRGSWVFEWRRPKPDLSDEVLIVHDDDHDVVPILQDRFKDRHFYRMRVQNQKPPWIKMEPITE